MASFDYLHQRLKRLQHECRLRCLRVTQMQADGTLLRDGRRLVNFGCNDYLGLAVRSTQGTQAATAGVPASGAGASPLVCGFTPLHQQLCQELAELEQTEAVALFPSGYAACCGVVAALADQGDLVLSDALNHASLIDGCRLSHAERIIYRHADVTALAKVLASRRRHYRRVWIVSDGVFSMDGRLAPLGELCELAQRYDAALIVDEAHGTGVLGEDGSGACAELGVKSQVPIRIGTLSKAVGSQGGFVASTEVVVRYLVNHCRQLMFSTAAAPSVVAGALAGVRSIRHDPAARQRVRRLAAALRQRLGIAGGDRASDEVPIVPIVLGDDAAALQAADSALAAGLYIPAIRPPTVPPGTARLRVSLSAAHSEDQIEQLGDFLQRCRS